MIFVIDLLFLTNKRDFKANKVQFPDTRSPHISYSGDIMDVTSVRSSEYRLDINRLIYLAQGGTKSIFLLVIKKVGRKECKCTTR
jgi:hypothetical protein